jgi:hypothetical protein
MRQHRQKLVEAGMDIGAGHDAIDFIGEQVHPRRPEWQSHQLRLEVRIHPARRESRHRRPTK